MRKILFFISLFFVAMPCVAQNNSGRSGNSGEPMHRQEVTEQVTPAQVAQNYTDMLERELGLNKKQTKKVYKIYYAKAKDEMGDDSMSGSRPSGPPSGGPGMEGNRGNMGGRPPGMSGGGRPPMDRQQSADMPQRERPAMGMSQESLEDIEKREKKMKKILNDDQYRRWLKMEADRSMRRDERMRPNEERER